MLKASAPSKRPRATKGSFRKWTATAANSGPLLMFAAHSSVRPICLAPRWTSPRGRRFISRWSGRLHGAFRRSDFRGRKRRNDSQRRLLTNKVETVGRRPKRFFLSCFGFSPSASCSAVETKGPHAEGSARTNAASSSAHWRNNNG